MLVLGRLLILIAIIIGIVAVRMDTTVQINYSDGTLPQRVNNFGLMNEKQNYFIIALILLILGIGLIVIANQVYFGKRKTDTKQTTDELGKLFELKQKGIITEDEFKNAKSKLL